MESKECYYFTMYFLILETGARVISLTFDGAPSNIAMVNVLGCNTNLEHLNTSFSLNSNHIYIFYDPCHMLKLIRNAFGEKKILMDCDDNLIEWRFIEALVTLQENEGLHLANKLRRAHSNFFKQKMKVRLAVQLLSESVADALEFCEEKLKLSEFRGCGATVQFIRLFNNAYDILNSRSIIPHGYKKALCPKNIETTREAIQKTIDYIKGLKFTNNELVKSKRKTVS